MNKDKLLKKIQTISVENKTVKELYTEISEACMAEIAQDWGKQPYRNAYYLSMEFLMGRMFFNNLMALGMLKETREIFAQKGVDLNCFEEVEDAALGNGGLGRLAACYLDSAAAESYPLHGYGIRYRYGLFRQTFENGFQKEEADDWLKWGDPWSVRREKEARTIKFEDMTVTAVPYDMPIIGKRINTLRLFQAEGSPEAEKISEYLYPADDTKEGKLLRIRQEYFFSAAAIGELVEKFVKKNGNKFERFSLANCIQLNDTHPVFAIAELLRILHYEHQIPFSVALEIARKTFNYTNHTILPEALECWDMDLVAKILPEIALILKRLQIFAAQEWQSMKCSKGAQKEMGIVQGNNFSMANVAVFVADKVNGVAEIHSQILKESLFATAYKYYPEKFMNVTNGVTQRRWLMLCNEELSAFYDESLGKMWRSDFAEISEIHCSNASNLAAFREIKEKKKRQLAEYIEKREGIKLLPEAIYVAQVKRLHEYKRQLMTALAILRLYYDLKEGRITDFTPTVFIFGAKAASGYKRAKGIIKFINEIAALINRDEEVNARLQVVFVQNYDVSYAEKIIAGSDVSLQVSTAGFEASGTGNMKLMMNGAVTVGTMDGANIEIVEHAGEENNYIFGATVEEIAEIAPTYNPAEIAEHNLKIKRVVDTLTDGTFSDGNTGYFKELYASLFEKTYNNADHFFILLDLESYVETLLRVNDEYKDKSLFSRKQLINATSSAFFSSDRAIELYASEIWHIDNA